MLRKLLLVATLLVAPTFARAEWYEASSKHFVVYSDDSEADVRSFTERLERFDQALRRITGTPDRPLSPSSRVIVFVVSDVSKIQKLAGRRFVAGFYIPRASGPVSFVPRKTNGDLDANVILQHEYGHSFMFSAWPDVAFPPWFVEGFAEYVGTAMARDDGSLLFGKNPEYRKYTVGKTYLPAEKLVLLDPGKLDVYETDSLYSRGWLLSHYLLNDPERAKMLIAYVGALNAGKSVDEANNALGDIGSLDTKLTNYAKRPSLPSKLVPGNAVPIQPIRIRKLSAGEAVTIEARFLTARGFEDEDGVDEKAAKEAAALARRLAAPYPNDAAAQGVLAEAEFVTKNYDAAVAAANRAIAADPKSIRALLVKGRAEIEIAKKDPATSVGEWKTIRASLLAANKLDTEYPEPLIAFYDSFEAAGQEPGKGAQDALLYAYVLAPYDMELRKKAGTLLIRQNKLKQARVAFELVAYNPHSGKDESKVAKEVLKALDANDGPAALKVLSDAAAAKQKKQEEKTKKKA